MQPQQAYNEQSNVPVRTGIRQYLEQQQQRVEWLLDGSEYIQARSLINKFLFALSQSDKLMKCDSKSVLHSLLFCAEKKMAPINGKIILVPFETKEGVKCQAQMGVQGIRELIRRNPEVKRVGGDIVREKDEFKLISGLEPSIHHVPDLKGDSPITGSYAFAEMRGGGYIIRYCNQDDIMKSKAESKGSSSPYSPWNKFYSEMVRLVPLRKLAKELITDEAPTFDTAYEKEIGQRNVVPFRSHQEVIDQETEVVEYLQDEPYEDREGEI